MTRLSKAPASNPIMQKILDTVERIGNAVPHPVVIFLILIAIVMVVSHILYLFGAQVSYQVINPDTFEIQTATTKANSLLNADGIRHIYTRLVPNFHRFQRRRAPDRRHDRASALRRRPAWSMR